MLASRYKDLIQEEIGTLDIDWKLIAAIIMVESGGNPYAMRFETVWRYHLPLGQMIDISQMIGCSLETERMGEATSWGLMQVMGTVAREYGFRGWFTELCDPRLGIKYGIKHLQSKRVKYGSIQDAVSAYNAGNVRKTPGGMFENQRYVDKVFGYMGCGM